jgi:dTDP-4-amino-4,6-dideoxygalactose transaminase
VTKVTVPYLDFTHQHAPLQGEFEAAFHQISESGNFVLGPEVQAFETAFAKVCGTAHAIAVNSGTAALHLSLLAAGIVSGDEVIMPAMTFVATAAAIRYVGAIPVLVDIDPHTYCIDSNKIEAALTEKTKAIIPVHLYGLPCDMAAVQEIATRHNLTVVADAAQAHGAKYNGDHVGRFGDLAAFSFYPGKNLGAFGEAGAVVTNDSVLADLVMKMRDWGQVGKGNHELLGFNYRMDAIQGAVLGIKLPYLESWNDDRRHIAALYHEHFKDLAVRLQKIPKSSDPVYHIFPICHAARDELKDWLSGQGIQTGIHYPSPVHMAPAFADLAYAIDSFPIAESLARDELSLPIYPGMTQDQIEHVIWAVTSFFQNHAA